jgi:hypothetical protein
MEHPSLLEQPEESLHPASAEEPGAVETTVELDTSVSDGTGRFFARFGIGDTSDTGRKGVKMLLGHALLLCCVALRCLPLTS